MQRKEVGRRRSNQNNVRVCFSRNVLVFILDFLVALGTEFFQYYTVLESSAVFWVCTARNADREEGEGGGEALA